MIDVTEIASVALRGGLSACVGALGWSLSEYCLHRWIGHPRSGSRGPMTKEHLDHHRNPDYFTPWWRKLALALPVSLLLGPVAVLLLGLVAGVSLLSGFIGMWLGYEWLHRRIHTHPPRGPYGDWARRHHLAHHFASPQTNHGVTSPLWDWAFATLRPAKVVRIPGKRVPSWLPALLDSENRYRDGYVVVGKAAVGDSSDAAA